MATNQTHRGWLRSIGKELENADSSPRNRRYQSEELEPSPSVLSSSRIFDHETEPTLTSKLWFGTSWEPKQTFSVTVTNDAWDDPEVVAMLDYDNDGLTNGEEEQRWGTDKNNPDTDATG